MAVPKTLDRFISEYLNRGFGSMNKNDFEIAIFHYLLQSSCEGMSNYQLSLKLRLPESKVKRLRYEASLKYGDNNMEENFERVNKLLEHSQVKKDGQMVKFAIEDIGLRNYLDAEMKSGGRFTDSSFNTEIVTVDADDLEWFLTTHGKDKQQIAELLEKAKEKDKNFSFKSLLRDMAIKAAGAAQAGVEKAITSLTYSEIINYLNNFLNL